MSTSVNISKIEKMAGSKGRSFKILIVDDEPNILDIFKEFCELTESVEVDVAQNGSDALKKIGGVGIRSGHHGPDHAGNGGG